MSNVSLGTPKAFFSELQSASQSSTGLVKDVERVSTLATDLGIKGAARDVNQTLTGAKEVSVNSDALEKLFEMFDLVFKAMRSLLSGRGFSSHAATVVPHAAKAESDVEVSVEGGLNSKGKPSPFARKGEQVSGGIADVSINADRSTQIKIAGDSTKSTVTVDKEAKVSVGADGAVQVKTTGDNKAATVTVGKDGNVKADASGGAHMKITGFSNSSSAETVGNSVQGKVGGDAQLGTSGVDAQVQVMPDGSTQVSVTAEEGKEFRVRVEAGVNVRISSEGCGENQPVTIRDITPRQSTRVALDTQPEAEVKTISELKAEARVGTEARVNSESNEEQKAEVAVGAEPKVQTQATPEQKVEVKVETEPKIQTPHTPEPQPSDKVDAEPTVEVKTPTPPRRVMNPRLEGVRA
ncbi:hypothetical protein RJC98_29235 [Pseudomonas allii]|uniref:Uncharacterized protein n=2 Tax=Pseudomonas allii TaxID=2740531 RepID=A0ACC6LM10_9PSED|nr:hypothetical protein [Pseudomonas allii]KTB57852.1 hypothetical protein AO066_15515 [Pseudomonas fluorescens]MDR9879281.1 hypothetical protein [Pseudomonas allii]NWN49272.1 hypothetical protein [Pseudomonas allii]NWN61833.1 hypothetical protein [Pseudomonas allii]RMP82846.1 hypothetical protein ALQ17_01566 [Pseudomonas fluorescens]